MSTRADRTLRVDWITPHYPWTGDPIPGNFHQTQARALAETGVQVRVTAPIPFAPPPLSWVSEHWRRYATAPGTEQDGPIEVHRPRYVAVPGQPDWSRPGPLIARAAERVIRSDDAGDLLHAHFVVPSGLATRRVARHRRRPYLVTVHGHDATSWPAGHVGKLDDYLATLRDAAQVLTVSRAIAGRIADLSGVEATTLPLGIDHTTFRSLAIPKPEARRRLGLPQDDVVVLWVARLVAHKGLREFVDAILGLQPPIVGVLVGEGPLKDHRADEGRASGRLTYRGGQPKEVVACYMSAADMLVLPSYQEGLPTVLVEAGSLGLPVIASAVDGTPELIGEDRGLLLPSIDANAIQNAIRSVVGDPAGAAARADRLRTHVEREYDVGRNAAHLVEIYRAVVGARGTTGST